VDVHLIEVRQFVGSRALTLDEGDLLNHAIVPHLKNRERVVLDFSGVEEIATAFLNTAVGRLYADFSSDELSANLTVENLNIGGQRSLEKVLTYARRYYSKPRLKEM
jgi:hypothetical protein